MNYFSDEQIKAIQNLGKAYREFAEMFLRVAREEWAKVSKLAKEICKVIQEAPIKDKKKYKPIRVIKARVYLRINKPKLIHCRNNC